MMLGLGIGPGMGHAGSAGARPSSPSSAPNLLLSPEEFDAAAWVKLLVTVVANPGGSARASADKASFASSGTILQTTPVVVGAGGPYLADPLVEGGSVRFSVSGDFGGVVYTFSLELEAVAGFESSSIRLQLQRVGGFLQIGLRDTGDTPQLFLYGAKLEQSASFSGYP